MNCIFDNKVIELKKAHDELLKKINIPITPGNGIFLRYNNPIITAAHVPLKWGYDLNPETNPFCMERIGVNATFNAGAIKYNGKYVLMVRVEGRDRKSYFAIAESSNGIDNFNFWERPVVFPETDDPDINVYDPRLIAHEDGWIYAIFCTERKDHSAPVGDTSAAVANAGIIRSKDMLYWERLPDLISNSGQQRNVVLHPEFVNGKYAIYTRPQDGFIDVGSGGGIGLGYIDDMKNPVIQQEEVITGKAYHTVYELKNGLGPAPIKTEKGWLHLAHGVRNTAAGLRYVLYLFLTDLDDISKVTHLPGGYFMAPEGEERFGDVSNVLFSNGWVADEDGKIFIYYASSDTRMHVATSTIEQLLEYVLKTPEDGLRSATSVFKINDLITKNNKL